MRYALGFYYTSTVDQAGLLKQTHYSVHHRSVTRTATTMQEDQLEKPLERSMQGRIRWATSILTWIRYTTLNGACS